VSAVAGDFNQDGLLDLVVANNADGRVALLLGDADGLSLASTFGVDGMLHPTALALGQDGRTVYVAGESGEWAARVDLSLHLPRNGVDSEGQFALRVGTALPSLDAVERPHQAGLVSLRESMVALVATFFIGSEAAPESNVADSGGADEPPRADAPDSPAIPGSRSAKSSVSPEIANILLGLESTAGSLGAALSEGNIRAAPTGAADPTVPPLELESAGDESKPDAAPAGPAGAAPAPIPADEVPSASVAALRKSEAPCSRRPAAGILALAIQAAAFIGGSLMPLSRTGRGSPLRDWLGLEP